MDVVKVFIEEPVGLEVLVPDDEPDARRRTAERGSLEALLGTEPDSDYARAYLAGTHLGGVRRVGLTSLSDTEAWVQPLLTWADGRSWSRLGDDGAATGLIPAEAAVALRQPKLGVRQPHGVAALALGPVPLDVLAESLCGVRRDALPALRAVLDVAPGAAVLYPEPAHDGYDWSLFAHRPLRERLVEAFRRHPARPGTRRFFVPYQRARGEHTFYFEQWALDDLPEWVREV